MQSVLEVWINFAVLFATIVFHAKLSNGSSTDERLVKHLFQNYNKHIRPARNLGDATNVTFYFTLLQLISLTEKSEEMTTSQYITLRWEDPRLTWNPNEFDSVSQIRLPSSLVWKPDIALHNNNDGKYDTTVPVNALINSTGKIEWLPAALYKTACKIRVNLFPFDWQNCTMKFRSFAYDKSELYIKSLYNKVVVDKQAYSDNGEWKIVHCPIKTNDDPNDPSYQDITLYMIIQRRPLFYIINIIVPCVLISSLSIFLFLLPSGSSEKMTMGISVLLGLTVYLLLLAKRVPETSLGVPLIGCYLLFTMVTVTLSIICSIVVLKNYHSVPANSVMSPKFHYIFMELLPSWLKMKRPITGRRVLLEETFEGNHRKEKSKMVTSNTFLDTTKSSSKRRIPSSRSEDLTPFTSTALKKECLGAEKSVKSTHFAKLNPLAKLMNYLSNVARSNRTEKNHQQKFNSLKEKTSLPRSHSFCSGLVSSSTMTPGGHEKRSGVLLNNRLEFCHQADNRLSCIIGESNEKERKLISGMSRSITSQDLSSVGKHQKLAASQNNQKLSRKEIKFKSKKNLQSKLTGDVYFNSNFPEHIEFKNQTLKFSGSKPGTAPTSRCFEVQKTYSTISDKNKHVSHYSSLHQRGCKSPRFCSLSKTKKQSKCNENGESSVFEINSLNSDQPCTSRSRSLKKISTSIEYNKKNNRRKSNFSLKNTNDDVISSDTEVDDIPYDSAFCSIISSSLTDEDYSNKLNEASESLKQLSDSLRSSDEAKTKIDDWHFAANVMDRLLLVVFSVVYLFGGLYFVAKVLLNSPPETPFNDGDYSKSVCWNP